MAEPATFRHVRTTILTESYSNSGLDHSKIASLLLADAGGAEQLLQVGDEGR